MGCVYIHTHPNVAVTCSKQPSHSREARCRRWCAGDCFARGRPVPFTSKPSRARGSRQWAIWARWASNGDLGKSSGRGSGRGVSLIACSRSRFCVVRLRDSCEIVAKFADIPRFLSVFHNSSRVAYPSRPKFLRFPSRSQLLSRWRWCVVARPGCGGWQAGAGVRGRGTREGAPALRVAPKPPQPA